MTEPFLVDADFTLYVGDVRDMLRGLASESVQMCVTSPPYWGLRDYGEEKQLGLELTPEEYIANMVEVFHEVNRVLRKDGTLWLNIGDSYASNWGMGAKGRNSSWMSGKSGDLEGRGWGVETAIPPNSFSKTGPIKPKDLVGIPWMLAFALRADGWYLRSDVIWSKSNPMPESIRDRPTKSHEYLFLLAKSQSYYYDADAIREPFDEKWKETWEKHPKNPLVSNPDSPYRETGNTRGGGVGYPDAAGRNKRSVWEVTTEPYPDAHFATFPTKLIEPCILAGTSEKGCCPECGAPWERQTSRDVPPREVAPSEIDRYGTGEAGVHRKVGGQYQKWMDENPKQTIGWTPTCKHDAPPVPCTVIDPFMGSGTTAFVARKLGRKSIGIELNETYALLSIKRLGQQSLFA